MFSSTVRKAAETVGEAAPVDSAELVTLAELAGEGFGPWDSRYIKSPRGVIEGLAAQLDGAVVLDDLGRQCVTRDTARALFVERAEVERLGREAQERQQAELAELAERNRPRGGVPVPEGLGDVDAVAVLRQAEIEAKADRSGSRMDEWLGGGLTFHRLTDEDES